LAGELQKIRKFVAALPETAEKEAWGAPTFRVRNRVFLMFAEAGNDHHERPGLWCMSTHDNQDLLVRSQPGRYFVPPYVGPSGWVGIYLDKRPSWNAVGDLIRDAYELAWAKGPSQARKPAKKARRLKKG